MKKPKKLSMGLVGCGRIARRHLEVIKSLQDDLELVAVCDTDQSRFEILQELGIATTCHSSLDEMLENHHFDFISICTPSGSHPEIGQAVAKKGIHVVTEKPIAVTLADADTLIECCKENNVHLFVVKQNRLNETVHQLKVAVDEGRFGQIYQFVSNVFWQRPQDYYDQDEWRGTTKWDGGAILNQASHYVDLLVYLFGQVKTVTGVRRTLARDIECEDSGCAIIEFSSGVIGTLNVSMLTYPKNLEGSITIIGETGTAKLGGIAVNRVDVWEFAESKPNDDAILENNYHPSSVYGPGHLGYYKSVIEGLRGDSSSLVDGQQGRQSLQLIRAIYEASDQETVIHLNGDSK